MAYENMDIFECCTHYCFKDDLEPEDIKKIENAGYDYEEGAYNSVDGATADAYGLWDLVDWSSAEFDEYECADLLESWVGQHPHYLTFASGCTWNGASGYGFSSKILDTVRRPYEITLIYKDHIDGRALICRESSHDVPMGSTTYIIGLTDEEYETLEDSNFEAVEAFVKGICEK